MAKRSTPPPRPKKKREAALARAANDYANPTGRRTFGAPVTAAQIVYYENATRILCAPPAPPDGWLGRLLNYEVFGSGNKTELLPLPLWQWLGFKHHDVAVSNLGRVSRGTSRSASLPTETLDAFDKLSNKLDELHAADGRENKTWPRKHAIVLHALLTENA